MVRLNILQVCESVADAEMVRCALTTAGYEIQLEHITNTDQLLKALMRDAGQLVLAHLGAREFSPQQVLHVLTQAGSELPCIVIADRIDQEAVELLKAGACDYLLKEDLSRLSAAIDAALQTPSRRIAHQRMKKALQESEEKYAMLFERMRDGFAVHEMIFNESGAPVDYRFLAVNHSFELMTGLNADELVGNTVRTVLPTIEPRWIELYGEVVRTGIPKHIEEFTTALNKHFEVLAFRPKAGQFACLIRDATQRKHLEHQLLHAQKMEALGQLAGGVAHDFNNILSATMMHLSLLLRLPELSPSMKSSLKELETEAKRATGLTRQLLLFSRHQVMHICTSDLYELLANLLRMLQRLIGEHITLDFERGPAPLWIEADPGMIEQVIMNLCVNARDALPQGGRIAIGAYAVSLASTKPLGDTEDRSGDFVCLTVADNGCGMDPETLKRIFEPFFTTKPPDKGTGLGLATVYSIVKQHRGWINVHSAVGKGTNFRLFLPLAPAPAHHPAIDNTEPPAITGGTEGILVVEDDAGFRSMLAKGLQVLGYRVFEAANSHAALEVWQKHASEIALLLTDMVMPGGISGLDLCHRLQAKAPTLRRIITTGYAADRLNPTQLAEAGIEFLPKPFSAEVLAKAVRKCLDHAINIPATKT